MIFACVRVKGANYLLRWVMQSRIPCISGNYAKPVRSGTIGVGQPLPTEGHGKTCRKILRSFVAKARGPICHNATFEVQPCSTPEHANGSFGTAIVAEQPKNAKDIA
jgi:hypothetical protein